MTAAAILSECEQLGIELLIEGKRPRYRGPSNALTPQIIARLRTHKGELLAYLNRTAANTILDPDGPCPSCGPRQWWQLPGRAWHCRACEPDMPLTATTLTLPCHKVELRPEAAHAGLRALFEHTCQGLNITPEQLHTEPEAGGDLPDLVSGAPTAHGLRLIAETLAANKVFSLTNRNDQQ